MERTSNALVRFKRFTDMLDMAYERYQPMTIPEMCRAMQLQGFVMHRATCYRYIAVLEESGVRFKRIPHGKQIRYILD